MTKHEKQTQLLSVAREAMCRIIRTLRPVPRVRMLRVAELPYNAWRRS